MIAVKCEKFILLMVDHGSENGAQTIFDWWETNLNGPRQKIPYQSVIQ